MPESPESALPALPRILTPEEFHQARQMSASSLAVPGTFSALPPAGPDGPGGPKKPSLAPAESTGASPTKNNRSVLREVAQTAAALPSVAGQSALMLGKAGVSILSAPLVALAHMSQSAAELDAMNAQQMAGGDANYQPNDAARTPFSRSGTERALDLVQGTAPFLAGPVGGKLADFLEPMMGEGAAFRAAIAAADKAGGFESMEAVDKAFADAAAHRMATAKAVAHTAVNAAVGASYDPENPVRGATLGALLGGAARKTGSQAATAGTDRVTAFAQQAKDEIARVHDAWQTVVAPASRSAEAGEAAGIIRAQSGDMAQRYEEAAHTLDAFRRVVDPLSDAEKLHFIDAIEGGKSQPTAEFQQLAGAIRQSLDDTREAITSLGTGKLEQFIEDYFPHIWKDPEEAASVMKTVTGGTGGAGNALEAAKVAAGGKRPMEGSKAFLKQRTIPTTAEGIAMGLEPVTMNPIDLTLLKLREMQRYLMAHRTIDDLKQANLLPFVRAGDMAPDGYAKINDRIATTFGPRTGAVSMPDAVQAVTYEGGRRGITSAEPVTPEDVSVHGMRIMGEHWAPEPVARVLNNYLSPGLRGNALYDAYRGLGNTLNQAQLGLSAFHLGFTSMDAYVSRIALGMEYIASGKPVTGLVKMASAPGAWITNAFLGAKIRKAYLEPASASPEMAALADAVKEAGGRVRMDSFYKNSAPERMIEAWKEGAYGKATALSMPALFETLSKPLMEHLVPMQKLGIFGDLAKKALADLPDGAPLAMRRQALQSAWDSVDNRMGQVVYDNLFWNKTFKDLALASVRSVGWNLGTIREIGGGALDLATEGAKLAKGEQAQLTHRAAYVMSVPIGVGLAGAVYQYMRTGEAPQEMKDYFFPRTGEKDADGNPERVQLPSYMKDVFAYAGHPWDTVKHKVNPILSAVYQMLNNEDYFGDQIRNPTDPLVTQLAQEAKYVGQQFTPFSIRNSSESAKRGDQTAATQLGNWFGVTPAKRADVRSDAQNRMQTYLDQGREIGATPEDVETRQARADILRRLRDTNANPQELEQAINDAIEHQQLTPPQLGRLMKRVGLTPAQEKFKRLTLPQAIDVFQRGTDREKGLFAAALAKKLARASQ